MKNLAYTAGRKIFLNISSFQVLTMFRRGMFYSYLSIYLRFYLGLSVTETTLFASLPMICNVVFQNFVWGRVSDRYQLRRTLIIIGEITAAIITFIVWYLHTLPESKHTAGFVIIIGLSVVEIFWSMSNVAWSALLSDLYPQKERAGLQGRMQSIGAAGRFVGVWIGGLLYDGLPFRYEGWGFSEGWLFFIACGAMILSTIPMFFVPEGGVIHSKCGSPNEESEEASANNNNNDRVSKQYLTFAPFVKLIGMARSPIAAAMVGKTIGKTIDEMQLPVYVERFGTTKDEIFVTASDLRNELGNDEFEKIPTGALGLYTYYERLGQGLRQLMAGSRNFGLEHISRDDLTALTPEAAEISGLSYVMDVDKELVNELLDS